MGSDSDKRKMPDTPWHIGYTKMDEWDTRRHKARCLYYICGNCYNSSLRCYGQTCGGSSHCGEYQDINALSREAWQEQIKGEDIARETIEKYRHSLKKAPCFCGKRSTAEIQECR